MLSNHPSILILLSFYSLSLVLFTIVRHYIPFDSRSPTLWKKTSNQVESAQDFIILWFLRRVSLVRPRERIEDILSVVPQWSWKNRAPTPWGLQKNCEEFDPSNFVFARYHNRHTLLWCNSCQMSDNDNYIISNQEIIEMYGN